MSRDKRRLAAEETVAIMDKGSYEKNGETVNFAAAQQASEENSRLFSPEQGKEIVADTKRKLETIMTAQQQAPSIMLLNEASVASIIRLAQLGLDQVGVLNFASAKNPGGGFLNGAMAQEESLAASSGLYRTQLKNEQYYTINRANRSMMYTDYAIYSPDVVFFRDERFELLDKPVTASVLTLPAVNMGQVILKKENIAQAKTVMKERMRLALSLFAKQDIKRIILGAYGCGVFRNDPVEVARWWEELLIEEGYANLFERTVFAILASSRKDMAWSAFEQQFAPYTS